VKNLVGARHFLTPLSKSRLNSAAGKNINIANILGSEISVNISFGKGNIEPALV